MNERIQKLESDALLFALKYREALYRDERTKFDMEIIFREKFAELIIQECANVAADHDALDIYEEIREHFGVEE